MDTVSRVGLILGAAAVCAFGLVVFMKDRPGAAPQRPRPIVDMYTSTIDALGKPDADVVKSYNDPPNPTAVLRRMTYRRQRVEVALIHSVSGVEDAPPYKGWNLVAMLDTQTRKPISDEEVARRFRRTPNGALRPNAKP
jgi:hypothetical protein